MLSLSIILLSYGASAQAHLALDSLWKAFKVSAPDTNRVMLYIQLGQQYENNNPDSALHLYEAALALSQELEYTAGVIQYYTNATFVYNLLGKYDTSLVLNLRAVEIARAYGNPERLAACLGNVGASYLQLKNYEGATAYMLQALEVYETLQDDQRLSILSSNLSVIYRETGQLQKALDFGLTGLAYARKAENVYQLVSALTNLGPIYNELNKPDEAMPLLNEAIAVARKSDNDWGVLNATLNLTDVYIKKSEYIQMKKYLDEAIQLSTQLEDQESLVIALRGYAIHYLYTGNAPLAKKYAQQSLDSARQFEYPFHIMKAYDELSKIALVEGDYAQHQYYLVKVDSIQKTIFNLRIAENIQGLEAAYKSKQQDSQIQQLQQGAWLNRLYLAGMGATLLIVITISLLTYRTLQQRKKISDRDQLLQQSRIDQLEKEKQLMASEAIIKGQEEERARMAKDLHDGLGGMLSGVKFSLTNMKSNAVLDADSVLVFERAMDMLDHSISELRRVAHNMMPEMLVNFGLVDALQSYCSNIQETKMLTVAFQAIGITERLPKETEIQVFRIVQELLSNVLRHAKATQVVVQVSKHQGHLLITVEDDGVGFDNSKASDKSSAGLANIRNRLNYINGRMEIHSIPEEGTTVEINIDLS